MALIEWTKEGYKQLSDKEIKERIMKRWGLDPQSKDDQRIYKRRYDVYALRVKNYSNLLNVEKRIRPNESLLRTLIRQQNGVDLTAEQEGILNSTAQNTQRFSERLAAGSAKLTEIGIVNLEKQFHNFLTKNTRGYDKQYEEFSTEIVDVTIKTLVNADGEIKGTYNITAGEKLPAKIPKSYTVLTEVQQVRQRRSDLTVSEVKTFLESLADDLHTWQNQRMLSARGIITKKMRSQVGS